MGDRKVILYEKRCIALGGQHEDITSNNNCCNFIAILKTALESNIQPKHHLDVPSAKNTTNICPHVQNKLIQVISYDILKKA